MRFLSLLLLRWAIRIRHKQLLKQRSRIADMYKIRDSIAEIRRNPELTAEIAAEARKQYESCVELIRELEDNHRETLNDALGIINEYKKIN